MSDTSKKIIQATPELLAKFAVQEHKKLKAKKLAESKESVNVFEAIFAQPEVVITEQKKEVAAPTLLTESISISFKDELLSDSFMNRKK